MSVGSPGARLAPVPTVPLRCGHRSLASRELIGVAHQTTPFASDSASQAGRRVEVAGLAAAAAAVLAQGLLVHRRSHRRPRRRIALLAEPAKRAERMRVADKDQDELGYVPSRKEVEAEQLALLEATGALDLHRREEAYNERRKARLQNPSPMDKWEMDMEAVKMDTERRKLWGDLRKKSGKIRRMRGKQVYQKELEIKYNRGFPVEDTEDDSAADARDKEWLDMWRASWPDETAIDPHDPESFGFAFVGEITGAHGLHGDVRVRVDDILCDQGYDGEEHLSRRNFSNFSEPSKRVHLKSPHRRFPRPFRIITGKRVQRRVYALRLHGVETAEQAIAFRGYKVFVLEPPPGVRTDAEKAMDEFNGLDLYDANTTTFHTRDALELVGAKCYMLRGDVSEEALGNFAIAETPEEASGLLAEAGVQAVHFGQVSAVVPDYKLAPRFRARKAAHDLLDITLVDGIVGPEKQYLYEPDPESTLGKGLAAYPFPSPIPLPYASPDPHFPDFESVAYVPFVPDMIARVDATPAGPVIYFTLPKGHLERASFSCRKRLVDEKGLLAIPRGAAVRALLPPAGKSHALRRLDGKSRPLHGTAPAPPADMLQPAGMIFPEPPPGVPRPPQ